MSALDWFAALPAAQDAGRRIGITSVCSAHPEVIAAGLLEAQAQGQVALIEATCNQVNQEGGYTGMRPADFRDLVWRIAEDLGVAREQILLGGDHLGPNPWRKTPAAAAMEKAVAMTHAYAAAGFGKIHADASMSCADDPVPLPPEVIATRAARLVAAAEAGAKEGGHPPPLYIVGTEVPVPGGVAEELEELTPTPPGEAAETLAIHARCFAEAGLSAVMARVIGLVVQPGVEFGHANLIRFSPEGAAPLAEWRDAQGGILFEAHSTDYQSAAALRALVGQGFGILKVGPGLSFALREACYGLDLIAGELAAGYRAGSLRDAMEALMLAHPGEWQSYYDGPPDAQRLLRHFSYSDRIRYYWARPEAEAAMARLLEALEGQDIPETLISQYLPRVYDAVAAGQLAPRPKELIRAMIRTALAPYSAACAG